MRMARSSLIEAATAGAARSSPAERMIGAASRAMPNIDRQSPRLGVSLRVRYVSSSARTSRTSPPTGASSGSTSSPEWSSAKPSSRAEHSMPLDSTPRSFALRISNGAVVPGRGGRLAPTRAHGTFCPAATFGGPHTICSVSPVPASTSVTRSLSAFGCGATLLTSATTTPLNAPATGVISSTSRPPIVSACAKRSTGMSMRTSSFSHCRETFMRRGPASSELLQEAQVVLEEQPQVVHPVLEHREAIEPHAEREPRVALGVYSAVAQDIGMHDPGARDLEVGHLAIAPRPFHVDLDSRLDERKVRGPEPQADVLALEEGAAELRHRGLELGEADALVDPQPLDLVEHRRVRRVVVVAIDPPGADDAHRRAVRLHVADLHPGSLRAQELVGVRDVERVLHASRRMVGERPQRGEDVVVALDLGAVGDGKSHRAKELLDLFLRARDRVQPARAGAAARQRDVDRLGVELAVELAREDRLAARLHQRLDFGLGAVDRRTRLRTLLGGQPAQALEQLRERARLAEDARPRQLELGHARANGHGLARGGDDLFEFFHRKRRGLSRAPRFSLTSLQAPRLAFACSTMRANAALSETASSARALRSMSIAAFFS